MISDRFATDDRLLDAGLAGEPADDRLLDAVLAGESADEDTLAELLRCADPLAEAASMSRAVERFLGRRRGLGLVEEVLADPRVSEVMINGPGTVWLDRGGRPEPTALELDEHDLWLLIERILDPLGLRVDRSSPIVDARLPDGSRVNIAVPPLAIDGPAVTIRRFSPEAVPLDAFGPAPVVSLLTELTASKATMLVVGATAAGKTTLLNALGALLDPDERVVTIEDTAELQFPGRHIVRLEARPPNSEGIGGVALRALVRNALRMRPDRLVIGEVRGPEALDLVLALNTGHRGSLATCHASDPTGALRRLESLALLGDADLPAAALREQISGAIDVIVQVDRIGASRRITEVAAQGRGTVELETLWRDRSDGRVRR